MLFHAHNTFDAAAGPSLWNCLPLALLAHDLREFECLMKNIFILLDCGARSFLCYCTCQKKPPCKTNVL